MPDEFLTGALANPRAQRIIPRIIEPAAAARERGRPVESPDDAHLPAADPVDRGYRIVVPADPVGAFSDEDHGSGLAHLYMAYSAGPTPLAGVLGAVPAG